MVIFPADLATREERTCRGRKIRAKRHLGGAARVVLPAEVTM